MNHTPTPELFVERLKAVGNMPEEFQIESEGRAYAVCHNEEDAEMIVRAVNAHEELLKACKFALKSLDLDIQAIGMLEKAIAKAEGSPVGNVKTHEHGGAL